MIVVGTYLSVAVAASVVRAAGVVRVSPARRVHLGEIQRAVLSAGQRGEVHFEAHLLAEQFHQHIVPVGPEQVDARRGVVGRAVDRDVLVHRHGIAGRGYAAGGVVCAFDNAILGTCGLVWAQGSVDAAGGGARGATVDRMDPVIAPVEHDRGVLLHAAAACCALPCRQFGVHFGRFCARVLGVGHLKRSQCRHDKGSERAVRHLEC